MTLTERIAQGALERPCMAVHSPTGSRCTRTESHTAGDMHQRGSLVWGSRGIPERPRWMQYAHAKDFSGTGPL